MEALLVTKRQVFSSTITARGHTKQLRALGTSLNF
jgi:hypothetical protein